MEKKLQILIILAPLLLIPQACGTIPHSEIEPELLQLSITNSDQSETQTNSSANIAHVWANEGGDKVTQGELRASKDPNSVINSVWDGSSISLFGARNEVVSFNLVLESPNADAQNIEIIFTELTHPSGAAINTTPAEGDQLFNYVGRNIELFFVRYLEIKGLSTLTYETYDERHIPERCRRPYDEYGDGAGNWEDRPCHNQRYPDIAVPLELESPFTIAAGTNQSIWGDIYIPKDSPAGIYTGTITIAEDGNQKWEIPIQLEVRDFALPDYPSALTMVYYSIENINERYLGAQNIYPAPKTDAYVQSQLFADRHFQMAHRHKISLIDSYIPQDLMEKVWQHRLTGELFTNDNGYAGVGEGVGNNVYSIGTYGGWPWMGFGQLAMWANSDEWVSWFDAHPLETPTDYFLYLIDESDEFEEIEQWASWMDNNLGPGARLMSLATLDAPSAAAHVPSLDITTSSVLVADPDSWAPAVEGYQYDPDKKFYYYNGGRPGSGTYAIEDDGVGLRASAWAQYKMAIDRWFYWESTYYNNFQCYGNDSEAYTNVYQRAQTFGCYEEDDSELGQTGWNFTNGDGVLFYPGTDSFFPEENYAVLGPFASLRLKLIRRGLQDVDYLTMAAAVDPTRTAEIVKEIIPKVLWEYGVDDPEDPTWVYTDISWSTDSDVWEAARAELADIIESSEK
ncbi:MAG: DUF4091 domain-containing protein [Anaerolineales bacterium]|nr:DUF4091 domain-containing protein [Chloroflexota bacterium]MBL6983148.1 DUF4091 domain-containing protein [Anaerolineales bacterium]